MVYFLFSTSPSLVYQYRVHSLLYIYYEYMIQRLEKMRTRKGRGRHPDRERKALFGNAGVFRIGQEAVGEG